MDVHERQLDWIRDGAKWLVGFSAGALVLSGTYFTQVFRQEPATIWPIVLAWLLLAVSTFSGVLCTFSAWKRLNSDPPDSGANGRAHMGKWVKWTYASMMWSFVFGYLFLAVGLIVNLLAKTPKEQAITLRINSDSQAVFVVNGQELELKGRERGLEFSLRGQRIVVEFDTEADSGVKVEDEDDN